MELRKQKSTQVKALEYSEIKKYRDLYSQEVFGDRERTEDKMKSESLYSLGAFSF